ncbi:hypothetical protein PNOK_0163200 [Pyrrhoderma noxium]|uniref:Uncharacterized protein n=1 Tax=Pyrrhoderma noxium TaxID=2282107 RepID=A0A286UQC0_9AGAM|nr:hypothetical protein PNOK_0163200 [Pyrrhoderma noxium]
MLYIPPMPSFCSTPLLKSSPHLSLTPSTKACPHIRLTGNIPSPVFSSFKWLSFFWNLRGSVPPLEYKFCNWYEIFCSIMVGSVGSKETDEVAAAGEDSPNCPPPPLCIIYYVRSALGGGGLMVSGLTFLASITRFQKLK